VATQILAPKPGTVVAIYGQPGETVTPAGLRGRGAQGRAARTRQPRFSLVPSGPMASVRSRGMALPVIALRTSGGWQVRLLIPQTSTSAVKVGQAVRISVPAAGLTGIRGTVEELSPVPVGTSGSADYLVTVAVQSRTPVTPLSGMTANIQLASLSPRTLHGRQGRTAGTS
jgi:hypothetical protein